MESQEALNLPQFARILRRRLWLVVGFVVLFPALLATVAMLRPKQYTATAELLFRDPQLDQRLFGAAFLEGTKDPARQAATNVRLASLERVADSTSERFNSLSGEDIQRKVSVGQEGQSDLVAVRATDHDPERAAAIANEFARQFIAFRRKADQQVIRNAQELVEAQLEQATERERNSSSGRSLRSRADQLALFASLQTGGTELAQTAKVPERAASPQPLRDAVLGLVLGVLSGLGVALVRDRLDRRLKEFPDVEAVFERPLLGAIPLRRRLVGSTAFLRPADLEAFQLIRASLKYFEGVNDVKAVLITSAEPGDGKSTVAWNLAAAAAQSGSRCLLIEADLRHPTLLDHGAHPGLSHKGLTDVLVKRATLDQAVVDASPLRTDDERGAELSRGHEVLFSGPLPPNPADLLASIGMAALLEEARSTYDLIVIDTPPLTVVSDAMPLVNQVDGVLVVSRINKTRRDTSALLAAQLQRMGAPFLGVVVNGARAGAPGYGYYDEYQAYRTPPAVAAE